MRSEYEHAVSVVSNGPTFWLMLLAPPVIIWAFGVFQPAKSWRKRVVLVACATFAAAFVFWICGLLHLGAVQFAKESHMVTAAEQQDWARDTHVAYAPVTLVPYAAVYSLLHLVFALMIRVVFYGVREFPDIE